MRTNSLLLLAFLSAVAIAKEVPFQIYDVETRRDAGAINQNFRSLSDDIRVIEADISSNTAVASDRVLRIGDQMSGPLQINSSFTVRGAMAISTRTTTISISVDQVIFVSCDSSGGDVTVTLPTISGIPGRMYHIKKIDSSGNDCVIEGSGAETIDGDLNQIINFQYNSASLIAGGSEWHIF